jgi:dTDP-4-dehydrorhamnose 3,5-epimerase
MEYKKTDRFSFIATSLLDLYCVQRNRIEDQRGFLSRIFCSDDFLRSGVTFNVNQVNHTRTKKKGTIRGMHYQVSPHGEKKLVNCLRGAVFDVAVDVREKSPTFLKWFGTVLTEENNVGMLIPEGFAHGFQTLEDNSELIYLHSSAFSPDSERRLNPLDPSMKITWPLPVSEMSEKDKNAAPIRQSSVTGVR